MANKDTVLVVDDMTTMRKILVGKLNELGHTQILEAENGEHAWTLLKSGAHVSVVVSDLNMPLCSGLELLARIRADADLRRLIFVMVTADHDIALVMKAAEAGVDGYLIKPFTAEKLGQQLDVAFRLRARPLDPSP